MELGKAERELLVEPIEEPLRETQPREAPDEDAQVEPAAPVSMPAAGAAA